MEPIPDVAEPDAAIDPTSPLPKYAQLRRILIGLLDGGVPAGNPLPSEQELCRRYGVSRMTVRQTLDLLAGEGRLLRRPGKGTFASHGRRHPSLGPLALVTGVRRREPHLDFVRLEHRTADSGSGTRVHLLTRVLRADGEPVAVERGCVPVALVPELPARMWDGLSLTQILVAAFGMVFEPAEQSVVAVLPSAPDARLLDMRPGSPALLLRQRGTRRWTRGTEVTVLARADRFQVRFVRPPERLTAPTTPL
ncbi:GntR family transcriptional regulator [Actinomadura keratinilytica]|uniref:GntR family transcriptional regulator n=1 Tax=Actinomadura keratinilytica TaxID=547461 RepID=UPI003614EB2F